MGPSDGASMAALYVRNRRQRANKYGEIPLSAGEIDYLSRKDEAARRRQRLLEVRNHEKRVAQLVTQRYRDNLHRLHAHKLRGAQLAHQQQQEALLSELHRKYQQSLQNVGSAHRQAREMLAELVEDAHVEQSKWAYNEAHITKARSGEASRLHGEEKEAEVARRKEVEDNLQRLKEMSMKQRAQASIRARREQERQIELAQQQEEAMHFRRRVSKEEVFNMSRPRAKDVDAYQFTRLHCVSAPPVPTTALKPPAEVKVIRHNIAHPSAVNGIDEAKKYRDEMGARLEQERSLREQNLEKAGQRGNHALEQVKSKLDGEKAIEWLQQIDKAQRYEQTVDYAHELQDGRAAVGNREDGVSLSQANERAAEETFRRMFAIVHDDPLELSTHSARTEEEASVDRVAMSPPRQWGYQQRRVSIDPADSEFDDDKGDDARGRDSFASSRQDSRDGSVGFEAITATFDQMRRAHKSEKHSNLPAQAGSVETGKKAPGDEYIPPAAASESVSDRWAKEQLHREADSMAKRMESHGQLSQRGQESKREHGRRQLSMPSEQFQYEEQVEAHDQSASLCSSLLSDSARRVDYQQQQHREGTRREHASARSPLAGSDSQARIGRQLQRRNGIQEKSTMLHPSALQDTGSLKTSLQQQSERGEEQASLHSNGSSHGRVDDSDDPLRWRDELQRDRVSQRTPSWSDLRKDGGTGSQMYNQSDGDEDVFDRLSFGSSGGSKGGAIGRHLLDSNDGDEDAVRGRMFGSSENKFGLQPREPAAVVDDVSVHSPASSRASHEAHVIQGKLTDHDASTSADSRVDGIGRHLPQQYDAESRYVASARSSVSSSHIGVKTEFQQQQKEAEGDHADLYSSSSSSRESERFGDELQERSETQGKCVSVHSSVSSSHSDTSIGYQFQQRDEAYDEQTSLQSSAPSRRSLRKTSNQQLERRDIPEDRASLHSSPVVSSASRLGGDSLSELRQQRDAQDEHTSLHSSVSSKSRSIGVHMHDHQEFDGGVEDFAGQDSFVSSERRSSLGLPRPGIPVVEHVSQHSSASSRSTSHQAFDAARENIPSVVEHTGLYSPVSSRSSSHEAHAARRDNKPTIESPTGFSDSFVRRQLLSDSEESFDGSVSVESGVGGATGDRGHLYIQKIHERLHNFVGRSSASSSMAQYSLPLSESMSSINESFHDHLTAGYGDDSFIHKLVPMFSAPGTLATEQMNNKGDHEIQEQYDIQLVDPALSRMLGDSMFSRRFSHVPPHALPNTDTCDVVHDETEAPTRRFEQWAISEQGEAGVVMEQHSLLSDSESGVSSVGFTPLLHLTAGITRNARDDCTERAALESEEKLENAHIDSQFYRRFSSDSSLSLADARFNYLASMTAAVGESLPLHLRLPAMIYGSKDMSVPPRPINWASSSSSSVSQHSAVHREEVSMRDQVDQQLQKSVDLNDNTGKDERDSDQATRVVGCGQERASSSHQNSGDSDDSDDEMQYEAFRRGLMEGKMGSLPPPPFGSIDMSRPPPPLVQLEASPGSQSNSSRSSSRSSLHSSNASRGQTNRDRAERNPNEEDKRDNDNDGEFYHDSSFFSEASASTVSRGERRKRGESIFISVGSDEDEEQKEGEVDHGRAVSLADAFRQRHPRFRERVEENREQQKKKRHELQILQQQQQQEKENTRTPNADSSVKQGAEAAQAAVKDDSGAELTEEQQRLLDRLAVGERAQVSAQEMKDRTRRNYQKLPEVVERKRQEEILRRRKQRLAELREQEKARRLQQKQRREQQKQRDEANN